MQVEKAGGAGFARRFDAFFYKRLLDANELTKASSVGALLTLTAAVVLVALFFLETVSFLTPTISQSVVMASGADAMLRVTFNISFPRVPCNYLSLDVDNALGFRQANVNRNVHKFRTDGATGRALMVMREDAGSGGGVRAPAYDEHGALANAAGGSAAQLNAAGFEAWVKDHDIALVAYGAPW